MSCVVMCFCCVMVYVCLVLLSCVVVMLLSCVVVICVVMCWCQHHPFPPIPQPVRYQFSRVLPSPPRRFAVQAFSFLIGSMAVSAPAGHDSELSSKTKRKSSHKVAASAVPRHEHDCRSSDSSTSADSSSSQTTPSLLPLLFGPEVCGDAAQFCTLPCV